jgi:hypothetical protein
LIEAVKDLFAKYLDQNRKIASVKEKTAQLEKENTEIKSYLCAKDPSAPFCKLDQN